MAYVLAVIFLTMVAVILLDAAFLLIVLPCCWVVTDTWKRIRGHKCT